MEKGSWKRQQAAMFIQCYTREGVTKSLPTVREVKRIHCDYQSLDKISLRTTVLFKQPFKITITATWKSYRQKSSVYDKSWGKFNDEQNIDLKSFSPHKLLMSAKGTLQCISPGEKQNNTLPGDQN